MKTRDSDRDQMRDTSSVSCTAFLTAAREPTKRGIDFLLIFMDMSRASSRSLKDDSYEPHHHFRMFHTDTSVSAGSNEGVSFPEVSQKKESNHQTTVISAGYEHTLPIVSAGHEKTSCRTRDTA